MTEILNKEVSRKSFLKGGGAMVVGFALAGARAPARPRAAAPTSAGYNPSLTQIDGWLADQRRQHVDVLTSQGESARAPRPAS